MKNKILHFKIYSTNMFLSYPKGQFRKKIEYKKKNKTKQENQGIEDLMV